MGRILSILFLTGCSIFSFGQPLDGLVAYYSFDACDATEDTGSGANGVITGNATCGCGVEGSGLRFDGNTTVQILGNFDFLFGNDFTVSFFVLPEPTGNQTMDIISKSEICGIDSTLELRFNPVTREMSLTLSQQVENRARASYSLPANRCYHHIVYMRRQREVIMFYDGVQVDLEPTTANIEILNNGILTLGGGPCLANGEVNFRGVMDELRFYSRALTNFEVQEMYRPIDQITTPDTVIFTGTSMQVRLPITCAPNVQWSPGAGVSDVNIAEPILGPDATTTYRVDMDYGFCQASDTIHVTVADSSDLTCDKIFFPTAFTPNGDNINDDWGISNIVFLGQFISLEVFDRWGGSVFFSETPDERWDGTFKGEKLMPGQYVYQFTYQCGGEDRRKRGSFIILK